MATPILALFVAIITCPHLEVAPGGRSVALKFTDQGGFLKPLVCMRLDNVANGMYTEGPAYLDTGGDFCFISGNVARAVKLDLTNAPTRRIFGAKGPFTAQQVSLTLSLLAYRGKPISSFPRLASTFYVNDGAPYDVILGANCFFQRIEEATFRYPKNEIILKW